ncbi:AraC family transcriptional regulator [Raoultella sp. BIGb0138]|uniref:AraC family transcriptional regulator n=1 Tax=Raoultella sp. BIGb0138 TaxID=2485115 RepID=UPI00104BF3BD|nr:AraC family transcriptional regulator [Raoultella sp. BIGb0138]TCW16493.1 AraC family transcriptional regulator [Raoultella sp. BIGb0138]
MNIPNDFAPQLDARETLTQELISIIKRFSPIDGEHKVAIPSLTFFRFSSPSKEESTLSKVALIFAAQGSKTIKAGEECYDYDSRRCLVTSVDMPISGRVIEASQDKPYLCFSFEIDMTVAANLVSAKEFPVPDEPSAGPGVSTGDLSIDLLEATCRLARLLLTPKHIPMLAPLIEQEIIYRILMSNQGMRLRHSMVRDSSSYKITQAVNWLKEHFNEPVRIEALARHVNMSTSSLYQHFKEVTSLSPLQYQKRLRLMAARARLLERASDVALVASAVGYDNISQFHREYKKLFGAPPVQDAKRLRKGGEYA